MTEKLNGFENYLILQGLDAVIEEIKEEIKEAEAINKRHIMTVDYIDVVAKELITKIHNFTDK
tara:strand:+ start:223 stop:411 length:189 start_codon:yes stop_codon:yes gene_type:complete